MRIILANFVKKNLTEVEIYVIYVYKGLSKAVCSMNVNVLTQPPPPPQSITVR